MFIGQAMPRFKGHPHHWPSLNSWLYSLGISDDEIKEYFFYSALVDYFPGTKNGSHKIPTKSEIESERKRLSSDIANFHPHIVVTIGKLSLAYCLKRDVVLLEDYIGKSFKVNPYGLYNRDILVLPLPHPSGASTWYKKPKNKTLLNKALKLLKTSFYNDISE
jgi:uracil-DNA glycosylase